VKAQAVFSSRQRDPIALNSALTCLATSWLLAACGTDVGEEPPLINARERGPAVLVFYGDTTTVQLPAATRVGQATTVRFTSFGGGCISKDVTEADVAGLTAEVRAYRREPGRLPPNMACTSVLRLDDNVVEVRFAREGRARVRIVGLERPGDRPFVLERELEVTP
jgi:hypothetical protein